MKTEKCTCVFVFSRPQTYERTSFLSAYWKLHLRNLQDHISPREAVSEGHAPRHYRWTFYYHYQLITICILSRNLQTCFLFVSHLFYCLRVIYVSYAPMKGIIDIGIFTVPPNRNTEMHHHFALSVYVCNLSWLYKEQNVLCLKQIHYNNDKVWEVMTKNDLAM